MYPIDETVAAAMYEELAALRECVTGVVGSVIASVDGLLLLSDLGHGPEPHDLAAMAAASFGLSRQAGMALGQGQFEECAVRSAGGYFVVYTMGDLALLAVHGSNGLNLARLNLEARAAAHRVANTLRRTWQYQEMTTHVAQATQPRHATVES